MGEVARPVARPVTQAVAERGGGVWRAPLPGVVTQAWTILRKDLLVEWRTRELVTSTALFGLLSLVVFAFALDLRTDNAALVVPGALWIVITFCGVGALGRSLGLEQERETLEGLLLAPLDRGALFLAKLAGGTLAMLVVEAVLVPVCAAIFAVPLLQPRLLPVLFLGTLGFAGVGTLTGAMTVKARSREVLLPLLLFPLAVPALIGSVKATAAVVDGTPFGPWLGLLLAYDAIFLVLSWWLFEFVVED
ncbi:MAG TPA: heme exporter protein CcmB [Chloroflexota bacterium]|nr:heme exporter protein CcmB [Chloroflexota bacterium]